MKRLAILCLALSSLAFSSCGTTGGQLIQIGFRAGGVSRPAGPFTFTTAQGWKVTLETARVALGPFYFNNSPPLTDNFRSGVVIIQATEQVIVNPLDPTLRDVAGGADGETGASLVCEVELFQPDQTQTAADRALLGTGIGYVAGTATDRTGATTVPFAGNIAISSNLVTQETPLVALQRVNGATAPLNFTAQTQAVELRVDPRPWFDSLDFSALLGGTPVGGRYTWDAGNCSSGGANFDAARCTFQNSLLAGVQSRSGVYQFALTP
jgi:hypothetical protein